MRTRLLLPLILVCAPCLTLGLTLEPAWAQAIGQLQPETVAACETCHGANGQTRSPQTPRLNGQTREYLEARLKDLRNPNRQSISAIHNMLGPVRSIRSDEVAPLAAHFAAQAPTPANSRAHDAGARLYAEGQGAQVPACAGCHGAKGEGRGVNPRLAGQHAAYLQAQLEALQLVIRVQPAMNKHAWAMTPEQMQALAAFLAD